MPLEVQCGDCGKRYKVADQFAGKKAKCKNCGAQMLVPMPAPAAPVAEEPAAEMDFDALAALENSRQVDESAPVPIGPPPLPFAGAATAPPPLPRVGVIPSLAKAVNIKPGSGLGFRLNRLVFILIGGGCALGFFGIQELRLASASSATPQTMTCLQLEQNGPGNNAHIHLTNFGFTRHYIYERDKNNTSADWKTIWNPLVSTDGAFFKNAITSVKAGKMTLAQIQDPIDIQVLMKTHNIKNENQLQAFRNSASSIEGVVINKIDSLKGEEARLLEQSFPGADFSKVWIIEEGREPASAIKYMAMLGGAVLLLLGGLFVMLRPS